MSTSSHALRCLAALTCTLLTLGLALSCNESEGDESDAPLPVGSVAQALTDTDSDGMDDDWEVTHFGNLSATGAGDSDSDGLTNGEEFLYGFVPTYRSGNCDPQR